MAMIEREDEEKEDVEEERPTEDDGKPMLNYAIFSSVLKRSKN